ncbi:phospholipase/carboxylesterase [Kordia sp. SMS9]|uniref:alpha/beta hydrolase n=1 Tax=Kordia sp. SMS9 TaxID=2282170 RepID=UPI000E0D73FF|nr:esterase [Kordia sp. SMS9]AXG71897.1 phospholipase/carboxylesterase [Kordia sp. SMS9]
MKEKEIAYQITNTYSTMNELTEQTKNVWFVCHGIGFLSRYFIKYFETLNAEENYIIAPQASSKYYLNNEYKHVGASWLTKENTQAEIKNVMANLNAIYHAEQIPNRLNFFVLGFSQGVSVAMRWVARHKIPCDKLMIYAGSIPTELTKKDFEFLHTETTKIINIVGLQDEYFTETRMQQEHEKMQLLFENNYIFKTFQGTHKVSRTALEMLKKL